MELNKEEIEKEIKDLENRVEYLNGWISGRTKALVLENRILMLKNRLMLIRILDILSKITAAAIKANKQ